MMERNMNESRKAFESWLMEEFGYRHDYLEYWRGEGDYKSHPDLRSHWQGWTAAWQASREELDIELTPACWRTYYPDTDEHQYRAHSESGPESCARRIASEIGGYVVPVYYGKPQNCAAVIKVKE